MKKKIILLILCSCLFQSCFQESTLGPTTEQGEVDVFFLSRAAGTYTSGTDDVIDSKVVEMDIVVCHNGEFLYYRPAWSREQGYRSTLKTGNDLTLHFIANGRQLLRNLEDAGKLDPGMNWEKEIRPVLVDHSPERLAGAQTPVPMWGMLTDQEIKEGQTYHLGDVALLRSVASADVVVTDETFELAVVYLFFAPSAGLIAPDPANVTGGEVTKPEMPEGSACEVTLTTAGSVPDQNAFLSTLFFYENDATEREANGKRRTRLVIGGYHTGEYDLTFYPLDFRQGETWLTIRRNHKYFFSVGEVSGNGYTSPEDAAEALPVKMNYNITDWVHEEGREIGVDGPYYLSITGKVAFLAPASGSTVSIGLKTNVNKEEVEMAFKEGTPFTIPGNEEGNNVFRSIQSDIFKVELIQEKGELASLLFTARKEWKENENPKQTIILTAGRIRFEINIIQQKGNDTEWIDGGHTNVED